MAFSIKGEATMRATTVARHGSIPTKDYSTTAQMALAWLLTRSPIMLAIPGTSSRLHLKENMAALHRGGEGDTGTP